MKPASPRAPPPRWATVVQWLVLLALVGSAIFDAQFGNGISMAINCMMIGFIVACMTFSKLIDQRVEMIDKLMVKLKAAEADAIEFGEKCQQAINDGYIEVIPTVPDDGRSATRH